MTAEALQPEVQSPSRNTNMTIKEFVDSKTVAPPGMQKIIKQLTPHWFRVKFYKNVKVNKSILMDIVIHSEKVYEVIETIDGFELVDQTL